MKEILLFTDEKGGTAVLRSGVPGKGEAGSQAPVLRIQADDIYGDFKPWDLIPDIEDSKSPGFPAVDAVIGWLSMPGRTPQEIEAAVQYINQKP